MSAGCNRQATHIDGPCRRLQPLGIVHGRPSRGASGADHVAGVARELKIHAQYIDAMLSPHEDDVGSGNAAAPWQGQQFKLVKAVVNGVEMEVFKNAPPAIGNGVSCGRSAWR